MANEETKYSLDENFDASVDVMKKYVEDSAAVRENHSSHLGLRYGKRADEVIDVFTPAAVGNAPVVAFFHGGWWKMNNRVSRAGLAAEYLKRGYGFVSIGYPLAPEHSISTISQSASDAVSWLHRNASSFGLNPSKIVLAGNSAGGHLAALAGSEKQLAAGGVPSSAIVGIVALSGIYDLGLMIGTGIEEGISLSPDAVRMCSPIQRLPAPGTPVFLAAGALEPPGFKEQLETYAAALGKVGRPVVTEEAAGHTHYSIIGELGRPGAKPFEFAIARFQ